MNRRNQTIAALVASLGVVAALGGCDVDKTQEAEAPDVDVTAEGGQLPEYDVETADVDVETSQETVPVPDVDVQTREETVPVPDVDVKMPDEPAEDDDAPASEDPPRN